MPHTLRGLSMRALKRLLTAVTSLSLIAACSAAPENNNNSGSPSVITVVAATTVWADIAAHIGGESVLVTPLIDDLSQDPHDFEPSARDELTISRARLIIENGGGYDDFLTQLRVSASPNVAVITAVDAAASVLDPATDNEHIWFSLPAVTAVATDISAALSEIDPGQADTFAANLATFLSGLEPLQHTIDELSDQFAGAHLALTEPLAEYLVEEAGLVNVTPDAFLHAVESGIEVSVLDLREVLSIINAAGIEALIYNTQAISPQTGQIRAAAESHDIPVIDVTEMLPPGEHYAEWMGAILTDLRGALSQ